MYTKTGAAIIRVTRDGVIQTSAPLMIETVAPGIFTTTADGKGYAAGTVDGSIATIYGTGIRGHNSVEAKANGQPADILYAGPQTQYPGLDQVNLRIPAALTGEVQLELKVNGKLANPVRLTIR